MQKLYMEEGKVTRQEFGIMLEKEGKAIYTFCRQLTDNRDDADELYQETMLIAMEKCSRIDGKGNPKSFLMGIAVKCFKNQRRKYARRQRIAPQNSMDEEQYALHIPDAGLTPEEQYIAEELCELVRKEIAQLKEKYRLPVYMFYSAEMSMEEIARALHIPKGTIKSRLYTARTIIKEKLEEYGYER